MMSGRLSCFTSEWGQTHSGDTMRLGTKLWKENEFGEPRFDRLTRKVGLWDVYGDPVTMYEFKTVDEHGETIGRYFQFAEDVNDEE